MSKRTRIDKLTNIQLQQKIIHYKSELLRCQSSKEIDARSRHDQLTRLQYDNNNLRKQLQERDKLIFQYNEMIVTYQNKLDQFKEDNQITVLHEKNSLYAQENDRLVKLTEELRNEVSLHKGNSDNLLKEIQVKGVQVEELNKDLTLVRKENEEFHQRVQEKEGKIRKLESLLKKEVKEKEETLRKNQTLQASFNKLQLTVTGNEELKKNTQGFEIIREKAEQITRKNVSYQQTITQLESELHAALELAGIHQTKLEEAKLQLLELETVKKNILYRLKNKLKEVRRLKSENNLIIEEKADLLQRIACLEDENTSFQDSVLQLSKKRESDEERLDHLSSKLNEVFSQTKTIIKKASFLQAQLEVKNSEINQLKKENGELMQEINQLSNDFEKSEARGSELENQIELMKTELLKAQESLTRLEIFETEKLKMKDELERKIGEFNNLTDNYKSEKDSYLQVLEHVQNQVNEFKDKSEYFDAEKGSWSKQIDQLKSELTKTKATLVKMEELERKNEILTAELQAKELEINKIHKEKEQILQNQMIKFNSELKGYQDKIDQYEKDKEIAEKQINELNARFTFLETNLKEKESFIRQYITQSQLPSRIQSEMQPAKETINQPLQQLPPETQPSKPQGKQSHDWFQKAISQSQGLNQNVPKSNNAAAVDFFTLRSKTTQPTTPRSN